MKVDESGGLEEHIRSLASASGRQNELAALLNESASIYDGLGTNEAEQLRAFILSRFQHGLPNELLPYVVEELETGRHPETVAAAAVALRGASAAPEGIAALLGAAVERLIPYDRPVALDTLSPSASVQTSAVLECVRTLIGFPDAGSIVARWSEHPEALPADVRGLLAEVGPGPGEERTGCCGGPGPTSVQGELTPVGEPMPPPAAVLGTLVEDQAGQRQTLETLLARRASVLAFFYTRCQNPEKCSLTVSKLATVGAQADASLHAGRINVLGITYDPAYDQSHRLRRYGSDRGFSFGPGRALLRTVGELAPLAAWLDLGVGYGPTTVNRHRLDLVILGPDGMPAFECRRRLWSPDEVGQALTRLAERDVRCGQSPSSRRG